jgi:hypothetical protein
LPVWIARTAPARCPCTSSLELPYQAGGRWRGGTCWQQLGSLTHPALPWPRALLCGAAAINVLVATAMLAWLRAKGSPGEGQRISTLGASRSRGSSKGGWAGADDPSAAH